MRRSNLFRSLCLIATLTFATAFDADAQPSSVDRARAIIAGVQAIGPGGIQELKTVKIGGIDQWISIRGADKANSILLYLHGGPGSPMMPDSWTFQRPWEDFFTVVQWDQRGAGKTFASADEKLKPPLSIDLMQADTEELIDWLRRTYGKRKIILVAHSWGSVLGLRVAAHRPDLLYAYVGIGQVVNGERNEAVGWQETLAKAKAAGNTEAVKALQALAPYPGPDGSTPLSKVIIERKWDRALGGMIYGKTEDDAGSVWELSPDYNAADVKAAKAGEVASGMALMPLAEHVDFDGATHFNCPVFLFDGAEDRTTPRSIAEAYLKRIAAPQKAFFVIPHAAHYVVNEAPGVVLMHLVDTVLPLAIDGDR